MNFSYDVLKEYFQKQSQNKVFQEEFTLDQIQN